MRAHRLLALSPLAVISSPLLAPTRLLTSGRATLMSWIQRCLMRLVDLRTALAQLQQQPSRLRRLHQDLHLLVLKTQKVECPPAKREGLIQLKKFKMNTRLLAVWAPKIKTKIIKRKVNLNYQAQALRVREKNLL